MSQPPNGHSTGRNPWDPPQDEGAVPQGNASSPNGAPQGQSGHDDAAPGAGQPNHGAQAQPGQQAQPGPQAQPGQPQPLPQSGQPSPSAQPAGQPAGQGAGAPGYQNPGDQYPAGAQPNYQDPNAQWTPPRKKNKGLVIGLIVGGGVVFLAVAAIVVFLLVAFLTGDKISDRDEFESTMKDYGSAHGAQHCADIKDTVLSGEVSQNDLPQGTAGYVCSNVDLTSYDSLYDSGLDSEDDMKIMVGFYNDSESTDTSKFKDAGDFKKEKGEYAVAGEHWVLLGNAGSAEDAKKEFGGDEVSDQ